MCPEYRVRFAEKWLRIELRRRAWAFLVLFALVALSSAAVASALAGARRGDTAVDRLAARTLPAQVYAEPDIVVAWDKVREFPSVDAVGAIVPEAFQVENEPIDDVPGYALADEAVFDTIERPIVLAGRLAARGAVDEVVVTASYRDRFDKRIGDRIGLRLFTPEQLDGFSQAIEPEGPRTEVRIVGVIRSPFFGDTSRIPRGVIAGKAFYERHRVNLVGTDAAELNTSRLVRLKSSDPAVVQDFVESMLVLTRGLYVPEVNLAEETQTEADRNRIEGRFLTALGLVAFLAATLLVGQVMRRMAGGAARTLQVLLAAGLSRRAAILAGAVAPVLVAAAGSGAGVACAVVASRWTPWGRSAASEPNPGVRVDGPVLGGVALALVAALAAFALVAAYRETAPRPARTPRAAAGRLLLAGPVVLATGLRFATQKAVRNAVAPSRMAMATLGIGVMGIVATSTVWTALAETERHPERFGQTAQVVVSFEIAPEEDDEYRSAVLDELALAPEVAAVLNERIARADVNDLRFDVATYEPLGRERREVFLAGSPPRGGDEIALGVASARDLGVGVGDALTVTGFPGERRMTVSGIGLFTWDEGRYDQGGLVSPAAFDALFERPERHVGLVALRPGSTIEDVAARLETFDGLPDSTVSYAATAIPADVLPNLRAMPLVLAAFIAVVTIGSAGGTAVLAVRRRRREVAVLRALGLTRRQVGGAVLVQMSAIAAVGLAVGLPLGMLCGRVLWRATAGGAMPLAYRPPAQLENVSVTAAVVVVGLAAVAAVASGAMVRGSIGATLRAE